MNSGSSFFVISNYAWASFDCLTKWTRVETFFQIKMPVWKHQIYDDETFFFPSTFISDDRSEIKDRYKMYLISKENVTKKHFGSIAYLSRLKKYFIYGICERQYY